MQGTYYLLLFYLVVRKEMVTFLLREEVEVTVIGARLRQVIGFKLSTNISCRETGCSILKQVFSSLHYSIIKFILLC